MDLSWLFSPNVLIGFFTLVILEIVLGVDNLVFVAIVVSKANPKMQDHARMLGLTLAIFIRLLMLYSASLLLKLDQSLFTVFNTSISGKDLLYLLGGAFLLYKSTSELHEKIDEHSHHADEYTITKHYSPTFLVIIQIMLLDAVFSLDSVITAVGMVNHISVAMIAVVIAMIFMIIGSKYLTNFINRYPTVVILCLGFLLMIGFSLILEGVHISVPKGYIYAAIIFSIVIEILNQISSKNRNANAFSGLSWRRRTIDSVLGMMGIRENVLTNARNRDEKLKDQGFFHENEKQMIRNVLTLAEKPISAIMTPRREIDKLNLSKPTADQKRELLTSPYSRLIAVDSAGIDEPLGYIAKKDVLIELLKNPQNYDLKKLVKQPLFIPENANVLTALELFRKSTSDIGLVVDEFGAILGLVSMKNILETIAGEFPEEYELLDNPSWQVNPDQSITVDGSLDYDDLSRRLKLPPLKEDVDFTSVAGLIMEESPTLPQVGDSIVYGGYLFEVSKKDGQKIERVRITRTS